MMMTETMKIHKNIYAGMMAFGLLLTVLVTVQAQEQNAVEVEVQEDGVVEIPGATIGRMGDAVRVDPDTFEFAEAETKLWLDDHLHNIDKPARLYYEFVKSGSYEEGFTDSVYLDIIAVNADGSKNANLEFFAAERRQIAEPDNLTNIIGNPVLVLYMQGDVYEMSRLTSGSWRYFQRRIKLAFSEAARIEPVTFTFAGKELTGEKISIAPYLNDPRRRQFEQFAVKSYEFILSDAVPGKVYQIKTVVPDSKNPDQPLLEEVLTLQSVKS